MRTVAWLIRLKKGPCSGVAVTSSGSTSRPPRPAEQEGISGCSQSNNGVEQVPV